MITFLLVCACILAAIAILPLACIALACIAGALAVIVQGVARYLYRAGKRWRNWRRAQTGDFASMERL